MPKNAHEIIEALAQQGIIAGYPADESTIIVCATEMTTDEDIATFKNALEGELK